MLFGKYNTSFQKYEISIQITYYHNGVITIFNGKSVLILQKGNTLLHSNTFMFLNLLVCKIKDFPIELGL